MAGRPGKPRGLDLDESWWQRLSEMTERARSRRQTFRRLEERLRTAEAMRRELDGRFMPNIVDELLRLRWSVFVLQWPLLSWAAIIGRE